MLRQVTAIRYVTPLREGGSLPGVVEADDLGTYVVKFRGAGQGPRALVAEVISGEIARALGLPVPELTEVHLDPVVARAEPDEEVQELIKASAGVNLGMDFLPGALGYDPVVHPVDAGLASRVIAFDAFVENVDRSWRNPNLLIWHGGLWLIDHGATLYFHHNWPRAEAVVHRAYKWDDHVLKPYATELATEGPALAERITPELLAAAIAQVPSEWLDEGDREAYQAHLSARAERPEAWLP
ncbi:aminotransferase class I and II [Actinoplanes bogorensis]|uniref:Aminotransferase class I and II n=1 Tax=Paractinoplanes bogorensis TaxID=1610840 RepID=A0ABS5YG81_9ACTN|nr:HipA family kinase [Actinoplanes bogorensis]MBU2662396.1 aminotransferase class I and II [Actinoplanes bogorensis]